ncbi:hypothetical protein ACFOYW_00375 [Gryllotalpicola reticulitermitis]|uniref:Uncharacterized protein n=1 Tax=Gryllotalpicola reticulitermitis TaxID=1184153 RepID=A0ABV8PZZ5_9MICO
MRVWHGLARVGLLFAWLGIAVAAPAALLALVTGIVLVLVHAAA